MILFLVGSKAANALAMQGPVSKNEDFSPLFPVMMFLRHAAGERAWHSHGHYANLTVDDAWLTQPYGHLDYEALLAEMQKYNFHTTIAFIPWNFDRSEPKVVQLFSSHGDKFSICIHGNNHDHLEFGSYEDRPFSDQIADIKQALARMEKFQNLTSLHFDRFMIFPQEVVPPVATLQEFKEYNFVAAANAVMVPSGSVPPVDTLFPLRAVNLDFTSFPLVRRYSAEAKVPRWLIAINAFLDNPLLFYCHQTLFESGSGAFDPIAETVNQIEPGVHWGSLGSVAQHLYLERRRSDADYDVLAFSGDFILQNAGRQDTNFHVQKLEDGSVAIKSLTMDGQSVPYELSGGFLCFVVRVPSGAPRHVVLQYQNDLNLVAVDVSKSGLRIALRRRMSDFRDITLSRYALGRALTHFYYKNHLDDVEFKSEAALQILLILIVISAAAGLLIRFWARTRRLGATPER